MTSNFEAAVGVLKKSGTDGVSLYDHLSEVLLKIVQENPDAPLATFENISARVKETRHKPELLKDSPSIPTDKDTVEALAARVEHVLQLLGKKPPKPVRDPEAEESEEEDIDESDEEDDIETGHVPDVLSEAQLFRWTGVNIGEQELFSVLLSLRRLAKQQADQASSFRFFGKILGREADYFIVESKLTESADVDEDDPNFDERNEQPGQGANQFVYFVTNDPVSGDWSQLPDVLPEQVKLARQIRRFFTGRLSAPVPGHPRFAWEEASLLRAQIARIVAATVVSPGGFYIQQDPEDEPYEIEPDTEEYEAVGADQLVELENWVHHQGHLRLEGRVVKFDKEEEDESEDEDAEEVEPTEEESEETIEMLRPIVEDVFPKPPKRRFPRNDDEEEEEEEEEQSDDEDEENLRAVWTASVGPTKKHPDVVCLTNHMWPGAHAVAKSNTAQFANIYVGWGLKYTFGGEPFTPAAPPAVSKEFNEFTVEVEPLSDADSDVDEEEPRFESVLKEDDDVFPPPPGQERGSDEESGSEDEESD